MNSDIHTMRHLTLYIFRATVLYSQIISTELLHCIIYLFVSSATCFGLSELTIFWKTSVMCLFQFNCKSFDI